MCLLTTMLDDYVDVCFRMVDGTLKGIRFSSKASVVTCAVPLGYGTGAPQASGEEAVSLDRAFALEKRRDGDLRVFPMDLRLDEAGGRTLMGASRSVAVAGVAASIEEAHEISVQGVSALGHRFRYREDVGSATDIARSKEHLRRIRNAGRTRSAR
jgi:phosphoribosylamine-glycine ligase